MFDNLASSDIIILGVLIGLILIVGITCIVLTIKGDSKKNAKVEKVSKKESHEPEIQMALATDDIPDLIDEEKEPLVEEIPTYEEVSVIMEELEPTYKPEVIEVEEISIETISEPAVSKTPEIIEEPVTRSSKTKIEDVLKQMEVDIEKQKYEEIDRYEEEQEENAVISYQELVNRKMALNDSKEYDEPKTVETRIERTTTTIESVEPTYKWKDKTEFSSSDFISPVFGRQEKVGNNQAIKRTTVKEELKTSLVDEDDALDETVDLLNTLKEYRRNL